MPFQKGHKKIGGSVKGKSSRIAKVLEKVKGSGGKEPLEFIIEVMNDETQPINVRLDAGKAAAPFVHRKQPTEIESDNTHNYPNGVDIKFVE
jgi:hypothetical protein